MNRNFIRLRPGRRWELGRKTADTGHPWAACPETRLPEKDATSGAPPDTPVTSFPETEFFGGLARIGKIFFAHGPLRSFAHSQKFAERYRDIRQNSPDFAAWSVEDVLVLLEFAVLRPMQTIFYFPVARNEIVEFGARNRIGIKTRYTVLPKYSNEFHKIEICRDDGVFQEYSRIKTEQSTAAGNAKFFSYKFGGPVFQQLSFTHKDRLITQPPRIVTVS